MQCAACGAALPPGETMSCAQCGATLAIPSLREAYAAVEKLAPVLKANAEKPPAEVVKRRLERDPGRPAAAARVGRPAWRRKRGSAAGTASRSTGRPGSSAGRNLARAAAIVAAVWLLWRFWR